MSSYLLLRASKEERLQQEALPFKRLTTLVAKCLFHLALPEATRMTSDAGAVAWAALDRAVSGARRRKAQKAAALAYDCVYVGAPEPRTDEERRSRSSPASIATH